MDPEDVYFDFDEGDVDEWAELNEFWLENHRDKYHPFSIVSELGVIKHEDI